MWHRLDWPEHVPATARAPHRPSPLRIDQLPPHRSTASKSPSTATQSLLSKTSFASLPFFHITALHSSIRRSSQLAVLPPAFAAQRTFVHSAARLLHARSFNGVGGLARQPGAQYSGASKWRVRPHNVVTTLTRSAGGVLPVRS